MTDIRSLQRCTRCTDMSSWNGYTPHGSPHRFKQRPRKNYKDTKLVVSWSNRQGSITQGTPTWFFHVTTSKAVLSKGPQIGCFIHQQIMQGTPYDSKPAYKAKTIKLFLSCSSKQVCIKQGTPDWLFHETTVKAVLRKGHQTGSLMLQQTNLYKAKGIKLFLSCCSRLGVSWRNEQSCGKQGQSRVKAIFFHVELDSYVGYQ